jgi:hypothetical protein
VETSDPDGNEVETKFWIYQEVGTYIGNADLATSGNRIEIALDGTSTGQLHLIAEVKDNGIHPMTRYVRFVVEVQN